MKILSLAVLALISNTQAIYLRTVRPYVKSNDPLFSDDGEAVETSLTSIKSAEKTFGTTYENRIPEEQMKEMI